MNCITLYAGGHDSAIAWNIGNKIYCIQFERYTERRYQGYPGMRGRHLSEIGDYILETNGGKPLDVWIKTMSEYFGVVKGSGSAAINLRNLKNKVAKGSRTVIGALHHKAHAAVGLYSSPYDEAIIITSDGGGDNEGFCIYHGDRKNGITQLDSHEIYLGTMYTTHAMLCQEVYSTSQKNALAASGKAMGLVAGGNVIKTASDMTRRFWKQPITRPGNLVGNGYHRRARDPKIDPQKYQLTKRQHQLMLHEINAYGIPRGERSKDQHSRDRMATVQNALENIFNELSAPYLKQYEHLPIIISGGVALNVLNNESIKNRYKRPVYVPSCPGDEGLALGALLDYLQPQMPVSVHNIGPELFDKHNLAQHVNERNAKQVSTSQVAELLAQGKIIGVAQGPSEVGPRALGFRSLLCDPSYPEMKDKLNTIKHREWYRPFAPICRREDAELYFKSSSFDNMEYMGFAVRANSHAQSTIPAVVHFDNTARLQTVVPESNQWAYDLLTEYNRQTGKHVLLNTSFNIKGKPILNTITAALEALDETAMDYVLIEDYLFEKAQ